MKKQVRLSDQERVDIIDAYNTNLVPMIELAKQYGVTRQAIHKTLKKAGVDTTKRKLPVSCTVCGKTIYRHKYRIRKWLHQFCSEECRDAYWKAGNPYVGWRHGQRIARSVVSRFFALKPDHVVHHEDGNNFNNTLDNLRVFANQGDHTRYHRGYDATPIWSGKGRHYPLPLPPL